MSPLLFQPLTPLASRNAPDLEFASEIAQGLGARPKKICCKYLYDAQGAVIYNAITALEEYYLVRSEKEIIEQSAHLMADLIGSSQLNVVELGPGDGSKAAVLLQAIKRKCRSLKFYPFDINHEALSQTMSAVKNVEISPLIGDFSKDVSVLSSLVTGPKAVFFLGSSIGNFAPHEVRELLSRLRAQLFPGDYLFIGFDLERALDRLLPAYNDSRGVTREFNLNLLTRINRELGGEFLLSKFDHLPRYNSSVHAMESYLVSLEEQIVPIKGLGKDFHFFAGETIHTESSHKFSLNQIEEYAAGAGLEVAHHFLNAGMNFTISALVRTAD